ncbi:hypothetical protein MHYP_G00127210 [Metynnis hypsauchen]
MLALTWLGPLLDSFSLSPKNHGQDQSLGGLALSYLPPIGPMFPGVCQLLLALCEELQFRGSSSVVAQKAFEQIKAWLTSPLVLQLPDPEELFVIKVDTSELGVGAGLS